MIEEGGDPFKEWGRKFGEMSSPTAISPSAALLVLYKVATIRANELVWRLTAIHYI